MAKRKKKKGGKKKAARKGKKGKAKRRGSRESLVVTSKMKAYVKSCGYKSSGDLVSGVNDAVYAVLDAAMSRCGANKRATVRPQDV